MTAARHKAVVERSGRRRIKRGVLPALAATAVTGSVVGYAILGETTTPDAPFAGPDLAAARSGAVLGDTAPDPQAPGDESMSTDAAERLADRTQSISRSAKRVTLVEKPNAADHRFSTAELDIRRAPTEQAATLTTVDPATKLPVTGEVRGDYAEVIWKQQTFWVTADYLAEDKPDEAGVSIGGFSGAPCANGSSIEGGITSNAVTLFRAVCAEFPQITSYGGYRGDGEHSDGRAIDIMVSGDLGWQVADYLRANSGSLGLYDIIFSQRIWTAQRSSEGWRAMSDRGSTTANHYDHVHVKVF